MKIEKLELEHLAPYLPYGLMCVLSEEGVFNLDVEFHTPPQAFKPCKIINIIMDDKLEIEIQNVDSDYSFGMLELSEVKPILRPLSDLRLFVSNSVLGHLVNVDIYTDKLTYIELSYLFQNNFDVFGLIESGLAVDINTLEHEK